MNGHVPAPSEGPMPVRLLRRQRMPIRMQAGIRPRPVAGSVADSGCDPELQTDHAPALHNQQPGA